MSTRPDVPAEVMRLADSRYTLAVADYLTGPQMIAEAIVAERARFVERVETAARTHHSSRYGGCHYLALMELAADLRKEGWA
jgi:hypothetical protein